MRKLMLSATTALFLSGCATTGTGGLDIPGVIAQVQSITASVCMFIPTAETVAGILAAGNPILGTATAVADAICAAVTKKGARLGVGAAPTVAGVPIHGTFLQHR